MSEEEQDPLGDLSPTSHLAASCAYFYQRKGGAEALRDFVQAMVSPSEELLKAWANDDSFTEQERKSLQDPKSWVKKEALQAAADELRQMELHAVADIVADATKNAESGELMEIKKILSSPWRAERRGGLASLCRARLIEANRDDDGQLRLIIKRDGLFSEEAITYLEENCPEEDLEFMIGRN